MGNLSNFPQLGRPCVGDGVCGQQKGSTRGGEGEAGRGWRGRVPALRVDPETPRDCRRCPAQMASAAWLPPLRACISSSVTAQECRGEDRQGEKGEGNEENVRRGLKGERKTEQENARSSLDAL